MTELDQGLQRARVMLELNRHDEAAGLLGPLLAEDPGNSTGWCLLALACLGAGKHQDALADAIRAISAAPDDDWPHRLASTAHARMGSAWASLRAAEEARRLAPHSWQAHACVAEATLATGENFHLAEQAAAKARALAPNEPDAHVISGRVSFALDRRKAARAHLQRALALDPQHSGALNELGRVTAAGPFIGRAAQYLVQAVRAEPRVSTYSSNVHAAVRRTLSIVLYIGGIAATALYLATIMTHLSRAQILTALAACVLVMTVAGAAQYLQLPPQARSLIRHPPNLLALAAAYASFLVAFLMIALSSGAALPNVLAGAIAIILVSRLVITFALLRRKPGRATGDQRKA
jgi:tetratricopeptide (TPR) repeat protein